MKTQGAHSTVVFKSLECFCLLDLCYFCFAASMDEWRAVQTATRSWLSKLSWPSRASSGRRYCLYSGHRSQWSMHVRCMHVASSTKASGEEFAIAAQEDWKQLGAFSRAKLLSLRWRSAVKEGSELPTATALGPLRDWPRPEPSEHLSQVATATASKAPGIPRLRGVAAFNGMAVLKMVVKPSVLKTIEAQPRHGLAIYPDGSLLNHSCLPNVNRQGLHGGIMGSSPNKLQRITNRIRRVCSDVASFNSGGLRNPS